eukprot:126282_1
MGNCTTNLQHENNYSNKPKPAILTPSFSATDSDYVEQVIESRRPPVPKRALTLTSTEFNRQLRQISDVKQRENTTQIIRNEPLPPNINDYKLDNNHNLFRVTSTECWNMSDMNQYESELTLEYNKLRNSMKQYKPQIDENRGNHSNSQSYKYKMVYHK